MDHFDTNKVNARRNSTWPCESGELLLGVRCGSPAVVTRTSAVGGEADEIGAKADLPARMSAVGGGADAACQGLSGPFIARS
jgi:hypothetical protein